MLSWGTSFNDLIPDLMSNLRWMEDAKKDTITGRRGWQVDSYKGKYGQWFIFN